MLSSSSTMFQNRQRGSFLPMSHEEGCPDCKVRGGLNDLVSRNKGVSISGDHEQNGRHCLGWLITKVITMASVCCLI